MKETERKASIEELEEKKDAKKVALSPEWSQEAQDELQDFIESQGIYIRQ